jgi:hypothetical protein
VQPVDDRVKYGAMEECDCLGSVNTPQDRSASYCCYTEPAAGLSRGMRANPPCSLLMM